MTNGIAMSTEDNLRARIEKLEHEKEELRKSYNALKEYLDGHCAPDMVELAEENSRLKKELEESARLHGMGGSREAKLLAEVQQLSKRIGQTEYDLEANRVQYELDLKYLSDRQAGQDARIEKMIQGVIGRQHDQIEQLKAKLRKHEP